MDTGVASQIIDQQVCAVGLAEFPNAFNDRARFISAHEDDDCGFFAVEHFHGSVTEFAGVHERTVDAHIFHENS